MWEYSGNLDRVSLRPLAFDRAPGLRHRDIIGQIPPGPGPTVTARATGKGRIAEACHDVQRLIDGEGPGARSSPRAASAPPWRGPAGCRSISRGLRITPPSTASWNWRQPPVGGLPPGVARRQTGVHGYTVTATVLYAQTGRARAGRRRPWLGLVLTVYLRNR
jgi:hypothetical protein